MPAQGRHGHWLQLEGRWGDRPGASKGYLRPRIIPQAQCSGCQSFTHEGTRAAAGHRAEPEQMSRSAWPRVKPDTTAQGSARARRRVGARLRRLYEGGDLRKLTRNGADHVTRRTRVRDELSGKAKSTGRRACRGQGQGGTPPPPPATPGTLGSSLTQGFRPFPQTTRVAALPAGTCGH